MNRALPQMWEAKRERSRFAGVYIRVVAVCSLAIFAATGLAQSGNVQATAAPGESLDFKIFRSRIEPIFLKHRAGHARCYMCHSSPGSDITAAPQFLATLSPGTTSWTAEQSRLNFERISKFVVPGNPDSSLLLTYPLAPEAGGSGVGLVPRCGRQFESRDDPDWRTIAAWVQKAIPSSQ